MKKSIAGAIVLINGFMILGMYGAIERERISIGSGILWCLVFISAFAISAYVYAALDSKG